MKYAAWKRLDDAEIDHILGHYRDRYSIELDPLHLPFLSDEVLIDILSGCEIRSWRIGIADKLGFGEQVKEERRVYRRSYL